MRYEQLGENWGEDEGARDNSNFLYPEYQEVLEVKHYKERKISSWALVQSKAKTKEEGTCSTLKDVSQAQSVKHPDVCPRAIEWDKFRLKTLYIEWEGNEVKQSRQENKGGDDIRTTPPVQHVCAKNSYDVEVVQEKCVSDTEATKHEQNEGSEKFDAMCKKGQRVKKKAWTRLKNGLKSLMLSVRRGRELK